MRGMGKDVCCWSSSLFWVVTWRFLSVPGVAGSARSSQVHASGAVVSTGAETADPSLLPCLWQSSAPRGRCGGWRGEQVPYRKGPALLAEGLCDVRDPANPWPGDRSAICTLGASILQLPQPTQADLTQAQPTAFPEGSCISNLLCYVSPTTATSQMFAWIQDLTMISKCVDSSQAREGGGAQVAL